MNARTSLIVIFLLACSRLLAQPIPVRVQAGDRVLASDSTTVQTAEHGPLVINSVRFYLSELRLMRNGTIVWRDSLPAHLIDLRHPEHNILSLPDHQPGDSLYFRFGTDSLLNVSGALSGDLDPSKGMYWAWNSGYINCKIEGRSVVTSPSIGISIYPDDCSDVHDLLKHADTAMYRVKQNGRGFYKFFGSLDH